MLIKVIATPDYENWFENLRIKEQVQIDARIARIETYAHFGDAKDLGDGLAELPWKNGRRVYFTKVGNVVILLLYGGMKNAPKKDIKKARLLIQKYVQFED